MAPIQKPLQMKHTEPGFWQFTLAYILLGCGTLLILFEILDWAFMGKKLSLFSGLFSIWLGVITLSRLKRTYGKLTHTAGSDGSHE